jgi:hypothetical protein
MFGQQSSTAVHWRPLPGLPGGGAAYQRFFDRVRKGEAPGYAKFKSKHDRDRFYTTRFTNGNIRMLDNHVKLPKLVVQE